jgi:hypothetical protein
MSCDAQDSVLAISFSTSPKKCCLDTMIPWKIFGEAQKLKCLNCGNLLSTIRIEKSSFIAEDWRNVCSYILRKQVFSSRDDVERWLRNNPMVRRWKRSESAPVGGKTVEVDIVRETEAGWAVVIRPYDWFAMGTLKAMWTSIGIIVVTGNLRTDVDDRIPTDAELASTAEVLERI